MAPSIELTVKERITLANQYLILAAVHPDEADTYTNLAEILRCGYVGQYHRLHGDFYDELSSERCDDISDILFMHRMLRTANRDLCVVDDHDITFHGFDGNNETHYLAYTRFLMEKDHQWEDLQKPDLSSHHPTLQRYTPMVAAWKESADKTNLTKEDLQRIVEAGKTKPEQAIPALQ